MIYITGDLHGQFGRVEAFCEQFETKKEDILIDAGINFRGGRRNRLKKRLLESLPITIFAIYGNHEQRPGTIDTYKEKLWHGGVVYYEEEYPDLQFAKDVEVFELDGKKPLRWAGRTPWIRWSGSYMGMAGGRTNSLRKKSNRMWSGNWMNWLWALSYGEEG